MFRLFCPNIRSAKRSRLFSFYTNLYSNLCKFLHLSFLLGFGRRLSDHPGIHLEISFPWSKASKANLFSEKNSNSKPFSKTFSCRLHDYSKDMSEIFMIFNLINWVWFMSQKIWRDPLLTCSNGRTKSHRSVLLTQTSPHLLCFFFHSSWLLNRKEGLAKNKKNVTACVQKTR